MRSSRFFALLLVLLLIIVPTLSISAQEDTVQSVCLVTDIGRVNDGTFNQFAYEGLQRAAEEFDLDSTFIETASPTDYERNITTCLEEEYDVIVTVGFLITDSTYAAAQANPDVYFIGVDQGYAEPLPNLVGIAGREDQAAFIVGALAGWLTESNIIGGVYGIDIPPVVRFRNGFEQGIAYANPDAQILRVHIDSFAAPDRGAAAAEQFIGEGADVLFGGGGTTGSGAIVAGAQAGIKVIGVDQDEYYTTFGGGETPGAENIVSSGLKRIDVGVYDLIAALVNGEGVPANSLYILTVDNGGVGYAEAHDADVPAEIIEQVEGVVAGLIDGSIWTGVDPSNLGGILPNITEVLEADGNFSALLANAELTETLAGNGPFTVIAYTDAAAEDAIVIEGYALTSNKIASYEGDVAIEVDEDGNVTVNGAAITTADIHALNGVIHVIDAQ